MEHLSPHGLAFVALQVVIVLVLHWGLVRWHRGPGPKRSVHTVPMLVGFGFVAWTLLLRIQPARQGGDPFAYTIGIFDGVSLSGIATLVVLHVLFWRQQVSRDDEG